MHAISIFTNPEEKYTSVWWVRVHTLQVSGQNWQWCKERLHSQENLPQGLQLTLWRIWWSLKMSLLSAWAKKEGFTWTHMLFIKWKSQKRKIQDFRLNVRCKRHNRFWTIGFTMVGSTYKLIFTLSKMVKICTNGLCNSNKSSACRPFHAHGCYTLWSASILKFITPFNVNIGFLAISFKYVMFYI